MTYADEVPQDRGDDRREAPEPASQKPERPSVLQTLAGALTAITVTYLMSFLGVAGTIIGVGLVSILTVLGNFMYSSAMHRARESVTRVQWKTKRQRDLESAGYSVTTSEPSAKGDAEGDAKGSLMDRIRQAWRAMLQRYGLGKIIGSVALVFVLLAGTVTVIEYSAGKPLSDIVRNEDSSGTTFLGNPRGGAGEEDEPGGGDGEELPPPEEEGLPEQPEAPPEEAPAPEQEAPEDEAPQQQEPQEQQPAPEEEAPQQ